MSNNIIHPSICKTYRYNPDNGKMEEFDFDNDPRFMTKAQDQVDWEKQFDELCKAWRDAGLLSDEEYNTRHEKLVNLDNYDGVGVYQEEGDSARTCEHEYVRYTGFTNSYEYCKHCDEKK